MSRDELILTALEHACPMLRRLAARYEMNFDDLYQESARLVTEIVVTRPPVTSNIFAYLQAAMRRNAYDVMRWEKWGVSSLNRSIIGDSGDLAEEWAEWIEAPALVVHDESREDHQQAALYTALHRLRMAEQEYFKRVYGLAAFEPLDQGLAPGYGRSSSDLSHNAFKRLRRDKALAAAILEV